MGYLREISQRGRDANPFFCLMDIRIVSYGEGMAELMMPVKEEMRNGEGWLQGGIYTSLGDEAMALAIYTLLQPDETIATVSVTTSFLRGIRSGTVYATARVIRRGRSLYFVEAEISGTDGEQVEVSGKSRIADRKELARCQASFIVRKI